MITTFRLDSRQVPFQGGRVICPTSAGPEETRGADDFGGAQPASSRLERRRSWDRRTWLGLSIVTAVMLLWWTDYWWRDWELIDEGIYLNAFEAVLEGKSPYEVGGYLYPPAFADFGALLIDALGRESTQMLLRFLSYCSLLLFAKYGYDWFLAFGAEPSIKLWGLIGLMLTFSTGLDIYLGSANLSFLAGALLLLGLAFLERFPWGAGVLLASSALIKPFAVPAVVILGVAGLAARRATWLIGSIFAGFLGLAVSLPSPYLAEMFAVQPTHLAQIRATSFARFLHVLGVDVSSFVMLLTVLSMLCLAAWRYAHRPVVIHLLCLIGVISMPLVWSHSVLYLLPILCAALAPAWKNRRENPKSFAWVVAGVLAVLTCKSGGIDDLAPAFEAPLLLPPLIAPILLSIYLARQDAALTREEAAGEEAAT